MTENYENNVTFQKIKKLIKKEEENALDIFDQKDFAFQVAQKRKSQQKPGKRPFLSIIFPKPAYAVATAILLVVLVAAVLFYTLPSPWEKDVRKLEDFFLEALIFTSHEPHVEVNADMMTPRSQLERNIKRALYMLNRREYSRQQLTALFTRVICPECEPPKKEEPSVVSQSVKIEPTKLKLEKRIKHLIKKKMIDRFFNKFIKLKEV